MLRGLAEDSGFALVLQSEALSVDVDDGRVVQDPIEHRHREHAVAGEGAVPTTEGEIGSEDHRAVFIALSHHLEEQVGLLAAHRQMSGRKGGAVTELPRLRLPAPARQTGRAWLQVPLPRSARRFS